MVFISENKVVVEFIYDKYYLDFAKKDTFVFPDTVVTKEGKKPIVLREH